MLDIDYYSAKTKRSKRWSILTAVFSFLAPLFLITVYPFLTFGLNQSSNGTFTGNATHWTFVNDDGWGAEGATVCSSTATSTGDSPFDTLGYESNNARGTMTNTGNNVAERGFAWQTFTVPGSGSQLVRASSTVSAIGASWNTTANTSWVRLDVVNANTFAYVGSLGCLGFNANVATTTIGLDRNLALTGGTTYYLAVTLHKKNQANPDPANDKIFIDNVGISVPPVGVSASASAGTTNASLSWSVSTATSTAASIHASNPYKVYRGTSSGGESFLANATTNSYSDTSTTGNTTYYYWITNLDTNDFESASSTEVSVLTLPGAPGDPSFGTVNATTTDVTWSAPSGGASSYKLDVCSSTTSCSLFTNIGSNSTTTYNLVGNTSYDYAVRATNATGNSGYSATTTKLTLPDVPGAPTFGTISQSSITVNWTAPTGGATTYKLERCTGSGCTSSFTEVSTGIGALTYADTSVSPSTTYRYRVRGTNNTGDGLYSSLSNDVTTSDPPPSGVPSRKIRLFQSFKIKIQPGGKIIIR